MNEVGEPNRDFSEGGGGKPWQVTGKTAKRAIAIRRRRSTQTSFDAKNNSTKKIYLRNEARTERV